MGISGINPCERGSTEPNHTVDSDHSAAEADAKSEWAALEVASSYALAAPGDSADRRVSTRVQR